MTYYMVKDECDQQRRTRDNGKPDGQWIGSELLTFSEIKKFKNWERIVTKIVTKKTNTYWCFGARFLDDNAVFTEEIL